MKKADREKILDYIDRLSNSLVWCFNEEWNSKYMNHFIDMKKNLLSIIILALLVVNIILSAIMMISVVGASKKTAKLVADIATILDLEINGVEKTNINAGVSMADTKIYSIENLTIPLKTGADGAIHYAVGTASLSMNSAHADYATYGETISTYEGVINDLIFEVVGNYTMEEAKTNKKLIKQEILELIQEKFGSDFIHEVSFNFLYS